MVSIGGMVHLAEAPAKGDLRFGVELEPPKHQDSVVLQGIQDRLTRRVAGRQPGGIQAGDFGTDRVVEFGDGEQTHGLSFLPNGSQGTGSTVRIITASAALTGIGWWMISTDIGTLISE